MVYSNVSSISFPITFQCYHLMKTFGKRGVITEYEVGSDRYF